MITRDLSQRIHRGGLLKLWFQRRLGMNRNILSFTRNAPKTRVLLGLFYRNFRAQSKDAFFLFKIELKNHPINCVPASTMSIVQPSLRLLLKLTTKREVDMVAWNRDISYFGESDQHEYWYVLTFGGLIPHKTLTNDSNLFAVWPDLLTMVIAVLYELIICVRMLQRSLTDNHYAIKIITSCRLDQFWWCETGRMDRRL